MATGHSVDPARRQEAFEGLMSRIAGRFARVELRRRVRDLMLGRLSELPRKSCWLLRRERGAEYRSEVSPIRAGACGPIGRRNGNACRPDDRDVQRDPCSLGHLCDQGEVLEQAGQADLFLARR